MKRLLFFAYLALAVICASAQERLDNRRGVFADVASFENYDLMKSFLDANGLKDAYACNDGVIKQQRIVVMPAASDVKLSLFKLKRDAYGNAEPDYDLCLAAAETAQPIYFAVSFNGGVSDVVVEAADGVGRRAFWNPSVDGNGCLAADEDFALFVPADKTAGTDAGNAKCIDTDYGVRFLIEKGVPYVEITDVQMYSKAFPWSLMKTPLDNGRYRVLNAAGACRDIFVGNIGQDIHPVLCLLYEDGTVSIMDVSMAINNGLIICSGKLKGFNGIVSFVSDGGGAYVGEDGSTCYEYVTIYAVNAKGARTEIETFYNGGGAYFESPKLYVMMMSEDMTLRLYDYNENVYRMYAGVFTAKELSENLYEINYRMQLEKDMNDPAPGMEESVHKGCFVLDRSDWDAMKVKTKSGFTFGERRGTEVVFRQIHNE